MRNSTKNITLSQEKGTVIIMTVKELTILAKMKPFVGKNAYFMLGVF